MEPMTIHRDWSIDATPEPHENAFRAQAWVQREARDGEAHGDCFIFSELGDYATPGDAVSRATAWAIRWLNEND